VIDRPGLAFLDTLASPTFLYYRYNGRSQLQHDYEEASRASQESFNEWYIAIGANNNIFNRVFSEVAKSSDVSIGFSQE
jgi:hypothetical protein